MQIREMPFLSWISALTLSMVSEDSTSSSDGLAGERMRVQPPLRTPAVPAANCKFIAKLATVKFFTLTTCHSDSVTTWKKFSNNLKTAVK